jgi:hypothetical protein
MISVKSATGIPVAVPEVAGSVHTVSVTFNSLCFVQSHLVGAADGITVGETDGPVVGAVVGLGDGNVVGDVVGPLVGLGVGIVVSGDRVGWSDVGVCEGEPDGVADVGLFEGVVVGPVVGSRDGITDGVPDGAGTVGECVPLIGPTVGCVNVGEEE